MFSLPNLIGTEFTPSWLPAPLTVIEDSTANPDLGTDRIDASLIGCVTGFILVVAFMGATYGVFGIFANIALAFNLALTLAALSLLGATVTLPGIAGLLLALGLSIDANILINERIREETRNGAPPVTAMETGFRRTDSTRFDRNMVILITMLILFAVGTETVKGFALTVSLGIVTSIFTSTLLTRWLMAAWFWSHRPKLLPGSHLRHPTAHHPLPFMKGRSIYLAISAALSLASAGLFFAQGQIGQFQTGMLTLGLAAIAMPIYIWFRFGWQFGIGAVVAMLLDGTKTLGFFALTGMPVNMTAMAGLVTIMGYSITNKIIVYDRIRENLGRYPKQPRHELLDLSLHQTLIQTVRTSLALVLVILPLTLFGGEALRQLAVTLLFGVILATSSSIFIAAPVLLFLGDLDLTRSPTNKTDFRAAATAKPEVVPESCSSERLSPEMAAWHRKAGRQKARRTPCRPIPKRSY
ncbi:protein translocase subunit SecF [Magnetospirillum molischianum]|uniref:protein translocase subunit SecF n=1 Tax=Magnetospirillum molischianum TaxID=1083 RepID=UPI0002EC0C40|nr:protein translocase subunit SecF [Magnetospirillum molischianum]